MERRFNLIYTVGVISLLILATIVSYRFASKINYHSRECERLGGVMIHGNGLGICVKIEEKINE